MKKIFVFITFIVFSANVFSQESKNEYLQKSKNKKTTGIVLLSVGGAAIIGGIIANSTKDENSSFRRDMTGGVFITGGIASSIASIPFFISAGKYKKRAAALVFNNNKIFIPKYNQEVANFQPTLSLKIQL